MEQRTRSQVTNAAVAIMIHAYIHIHLCIAVLEAFYLQVNKKVVA